MKIAAVVVLLVLLGVAAATYLLIPKNTFISFERPGGSEITISRSSLRFDPAPDHFESNGFDHIEPYVARLQRSNKAYSGIIFSSSDGNRAFLLQRHDGATSASLSAEWREEPEKEAAIRGFFKALAIEPSQDYLAGNGDVSDATRILDYPLAGDARELTELTKRIMRDLCAFKPDEALNVRYWEK